MSGSCKEINAPENCISGGNLEIYINDTPQIIPGNFDISENLRYEHESDKNYALVSAITLLVVYVVSSLSLLIFTLTTARRFSAANLPWGCKRGNLVNVCLGIP